MQHMAFIAINITTNEQMNRESKYGYLRDPNTGRFRNPFRRSCKLNCQVCLLSRARLVCFFLTSSYVHMCLSFFHLSVLQKRIFAIQELRVW